MADIDGQMWELSSSDGWDRVGCYERSLFTTEAGPSVLARLEHFGKFWQRDEYLVDGFDNAQLAEEHTVLLPQVVIPKVQLDKLAELLHRWLGAPFAFEHEMCGLDQNLVISLGEDETMICSIDRPACVITYATPRINLRTCFVTDQSCIAVMADSLGGWLNARYRGPGLVFPFGDG